METKRHKPGRPTSTLSVPLLLFFFAFTTPSLSQSLSENYITKDAALHIALKQKYLIKQRGWQIQAPQLDSTNRVWKITSGKLTFRKRGRTTKNYATDMCKKCGDINGCHVWKSRTISIDARSGKVLDKKKEKRVAGNYE